MFLYVFVYNFGVFRDVWHSLNLPHFHLDTWTPTVGCNMMNVWTRLLTTRPSKKRKVLSMFFLCQIAITCLQVIFYGWMRDRSVKMIDITYYIFRINWEIMGPLISSFLPFFLSWPFQCKKTQGTESHCGDLIPSITFGRESREGWLGAWRVSFLRRVPGIQTSRVGWKGWCGLRRVAPCFFFFWRNLPSWTFSSRFFFGKTFFFQIQPWRMTLRQSCSFSF